MPKIVDHKKRRIEILENSQDLFATQGYAALSMRKISNSLGVTTGTLYHYFPNKRSILEALFVFIQRRDIAEATKNNTPNDTSLVRWANLKKFVVQREGSLCKMLQISLEYRRVFPDSSEVLENLIANYRNAMVTWLFLPDEKTGDLILHLLFGLLLRRLIAPQSCSLESQLDLLYARLN